MSRKKSKVAAQYEEELARLEESSSVRAKPFSQINEPFRYDFPFRSDRRWNGKEFHRWETQS